MIDRYFRDHPRSVGETYFQHMQTAGGFGCSMMLAGAACFVHALLPCLFVKTGSQTIQDLHNRMVTNRTRSVDHPSSGHQAVNGK